MVILAIILYCNIGWVNGTYYYKEISPAKAEELSFVGKIASGGWNIFTKIDNIREGTQKVDTLAATIFLFGIFWPMGILIVLVSWVIYLIYYVIYYAGWFIFAGGGAKLLGLA